MEFIFSPEEEAFRAEVREFLADKMPSGAGPLAEEDYYTLARNVRAGLGERGWLSLGWPEGYRATNGSPVKDLILQEELAYHGVPRGNDHATNLAGLLLVSYGSEEQKEHHLKNLSDGEEWWCVGFTEPGAGSDMGSITTRAVSKGDYYILSGQKDYGTWAHESGWCHLLARTGQGTSGTEGITFILLDMKSEGIFLNPFLTMIGRTLCEIFLDDVKVPKESVLGRVGGGWEIAAKLLGFSRSGIEYSGWAQRILDISVEYMVTAGHKNAAGRISPTLKFKLAEAAIDIEVARLLSYRSARLTNRERPSPHETSVAKLCGSEMWQRVAGIAMEVAGLFGQLSRGSTWGGPAAAIEDFYLESVAATIYLGSSEVQRNIIASRGLGLSCCTTKEGKE